ncbi:MAG: aromatase/cyclase [Actinomycetota bacterium]|nr:aromatase/cyclase [Actinomycetota bacterium]
MSQLRTHTMEHARVMHAPAEVLYELVADVTRWPVIFGPSLHVRHLQRSRVHERFELWALVGGQVKNWTSRRRLDASGLCITFEQEHSQAPVVSMGGTWSFRALPGGRTHVVLEHHFSADGQRAVDWIASAVDRNSEEELAALGRVAELDAPVPEIIDTFDDTVRIAGSAADAYTFINRAEEWPDRLPHVRRVLLREEQPGVQHMEMDTVTADGSAHTTKSVRICHPYEQIVYKQLVPPAMLLGHSGAWHFADMSGDPNSAVVTARHTVAINPAAVRQVLGADSTLADARRYLREALGNNGRATLAHAGRYAESGFAVPAQQRRAR